MERIERETPETQVELKIIHRRSAEADITDAFIWYEDQQAGLGKNFLDSVSKVLISISINPFSYQKVHKNVRRALLRKFPFGIFYTVEEDRVIVLGCFNQRRNVEEWLSKY